MSTGVVLRDYQIEGFRWLVQHPRSILADEKRLGKTIMVGELLAEGQLQDGWDNVLIIGKGILGYTWKHELESKFDVPVLVCGDDPPEHLSDGGGAGCLFINYDKLRLERWKKALLARTWDAVIVDEAHRVVGPGAERSKTLKKLARQARRIHFLTGSPMPQGSPASMWLWLHCCDPKAFPGRWDFLRQHCWMEATPWGWKIGPSKDPAAFARMIHPWMLRRTEADVRAELPDADPPQLIPHPLSATQKVMYSQMRREWLISWERLGMPDRLDLEARNTAQRFSLMRKAVLSPALLDSGAEPGAKVEACLALVEEALDAGRQVVVFTWHRAFANLLAAKIALKDHPQWTPVGVITGAVPSREQASIATRFQAGELTALVGTIAAMGEGITLDAGSVVIFAEVDWSPESMDQARKRVFGPNQRRTILTQVLVASGTLEEQIYETVVERRQAIANQEAAYRLVAGMEVPDAAAGPVPVV